MGPCCCRSTACPGTDRFFSRWSRWYARQYRAEGLERIQRKLLRGVKALQKPAGNALDIGCGVGALHLALLKGGAATATAVDASEGMLNAAMEFGRKQGVGDRVTYIHGDFVHAADAIAEADITLMDKVVCCYEDVAGLIDASAAKTRRILALTHPRDNLVGGLMFRTGILLAKLFRSSFYPFWHDWQAMRERLATKGFRLVHEDSTPFWQALVFERQ